MSLWWTCFRTKKGAHELDLYLSRKHDDVLAKNLEPGSYKKTLSLVIVDGFAVEITDEQVKSLMDHVCLSILMCIFYYYLFILIVVLKLRFFFLCYQANVLRSANEVRIVEKNQELV